jgi:DNA/RNA-binding domain of Phe-tRNA-synthetase-like protein
MDLRLTPHPLLDARAFVTTFSRPLAEVDTSTLANALRADAPAPLTADDDVRAAVRDLLRHGGYKPTGRGKPASEYLLRAVGEAALSSINAAVDACNVVSLHSGLPISVVDLDRAKEPLSIAIAPEGSNYVFNASGQSIDLSGLLCLFDGEGPCANGVKDAQRTKTSGETTRTFSVIWGAKRLAGRSEKALGWYREMLHTLGASTELVTIVSAEVAS